MDQELVNRIMRLFDKHGEELDKAREIIGKAEAIMSELTELIGVTDQDVEHYYDRQMES